MAITPAQRFLQQNRINFEVHTYDNKISGAVYAAEALSWPLSAMIKTLVVRFNNTAFGMCCLPGDRELSLKGLARMLGVKTVAMSTPEEAERVTGYRVGGISPFGTRRTLPVWLERSLLGHPKVLINAGRRGTLVSLAPESIVEALQAQVVSLVAE